MPTRSGIGERVVALVDVLGASKALTSQDQGVRFTEVLAVIINRIVRERAEPWLVLPHITSGEEVEIDNPRPIMTGTRVTAISDSIVISLPLGSRRSPADRIARIFSCIHSVAELQSGLLALGLRTRGGVTIGTLLHSRDVVVGEGLVRVHELESKVAVVPRAVVDESVVAALVNGARGPQPRLALFANRVAHALRQDSDGKFFVDYLAADPIVGRHSLDGNIPDIWAAAASDVQAESDPRILEKATWLKSYIEKTVTGASEPFPRRSHAGAYFSEPYPRLADNLITWANEQIAQAGKDTPKKSVAPTAGAKDTK